MFIDHKVLNKKILLLTSVEAEENLMHFVQYN